MNTPQTNLPLTRREFMRGASGIGFMAFSGFAPAFLARSAMAQNPAPEKDRSILVIIQLAGGNDGLNTVIPHSDDNYYNLRPTLSLKKDLLNLNDQLSLHPSLGGLHRLFDQDQLSIVQNVGYPNPNRSHFRSTEIWETGTDGNTYNTSGWLGRFLDNTCSGAPTIKADPAAIHIGDITPQSYLSENPQLVFGMKSRGSLTRGRSPAEKAYEKLLDAEHGEGNPSYLQQTMMNTLITERRIEKMIAGYKPAVPYPQTTLGRSLLRISSLIHADAETRLYFASQGGYDTHVNQVGNHARLLGQLSDAMAAFQADLAANRKDDQVLTMTFSEFGRRPGENASRGTDHGTAAPLFVMGKDVKGGVLGEAPNLNLQPKQDLNFSTDFRSVYTTMLDNWLQSDSSKILGERFDAVPFI